MIEHMLEEDVQEAYRKVLDMVERPMMSRLYPSMPVAGLKS